MRSSRQSRELDTASGPEPASGRLSRYNRVGIKLAGVAAAISMLGTLGAAAGTGSWSITQITLVPALVFLGTYAASVTILERRLGLARNLLRQIRRSQFENLEAAHLPKGDEVNDLVWQVYRTGQVLEREMSELRRMENYRREFIGDVSHELKTPIFAIRGFAETLESGALEDPRVNRAFVAKIIRNADRLDNLVRDLGEISRIEQGELKMKPVPFDVARMASEVVESLEPIASQRSVRLRVEVPTGLPAVLGDPEHIRQVVVNLCENAVKYNNEDGLVRITARMEGPREIFLSVADNGIGIPRALIPRITERFFRVDKSRSRSQGGTGLGLAIVKHILAAHDRTLIVESREGQGSTFGFTLPVAPR